MANVGRSVDDGRSMATQGHARAAPTLGGVPASRLAGRAMAEERRDAASRARSQEGEGAFDGKRAKRQRPAGGLVGTGIAFRAILGGDRVPTASLETTGQVEGFDLATGDEAQVGMEAQGILEQCTSHALALDDVEDDDGAHVPRTVAALLQAAGTVHRVVRCHGDAYSLGTREVAEALDRKQVPDEIHVRLDAIADVVFGCDHALNPFSKRPKRPRCPMSSAEHGSSLPLPSSSPRVSATSVLPTKSS